ncbi:hypothetical protein [Bradyrhizobium paxllaeri]|uniref:hypothetical protein n=1 Tax=Bradyrhizobium paxllaeri TaxID=190148 RepID=UPI0011472496|nr:hypothetical protein [Bradyrhizobium paxllaeri]
MPNIYANGRSADPAAIFHVELDGTAHDPLVFCIGTEHPDLRRISFFDVVTARFHVSETTDLNSSRLDSTCSPKWPAWLGKFLTNAMQSRTHTTRFSDSFIGQETEVSKLVAAIGAKTDMAAVRKVAKYGETEKARFREVDAQATALKASSPKQVIENLKQATSDITALIAKLDTLGIQFSAEKEAFRKELSSAANECAAAAAATGAETFKKPFFKAVGTPQWEVFAKAAHAPAHKENDAYPGPGDRCILCERPLDEDSRSHIVALLAFVEGDAQRAAQTSAKAVENEIAVLKTMEVNIFASDSAVRAHVSKFDPGLATIIDSTARSISELRDSSIASLTARGPVQGSINCTEVCSALRALIDRITADLDRLDKEDPTSAVASLELERQTLRHREVLSNLLGSIETYVANAAWCSKAERAKSALNPRHITDKEKELFAQIVGPSYRARLAH